MPGPEQADHAVPEADRREVALGCQRRIEPERSQHQGVKEHFIVPVVVQCQGRPAVLAGRFPSTRPTASSGRLVAGQRRGR